MSTTKLRTLRPPLHFEHVDAGNVARSEAEAFIARVYRDRYGARLNAFLPHLLAFRDQGGEMQAAIGLRYGGEGPLFVEQYLDHPAEDAIAARLGRPVGRHDLVEVGNFASQAPGDARRIIVRMTELLHEQRIRWVLFAATLQLRNAFNKLHLRTQVLAPASSERLREAADGWGSYYDAQPNLLLGDIAAGHAHLHPQAPVLDGGFVAARQSCGFAT